MELLIIIVLLFIFFNESKPRTLLIDDMRNIQADRIARSYDDGIVALRDEGPWDTLYLDHDLASFEENGRERTGYDIVCFLEEFQEYLPGRIVIVSSNPVGRRRMQDVIDKLYSSRG